MCSSCSPLAGADPGSHPGGDSILAIALFVTLGSLLVQGTTIGWLTRRLSFDLTRDPALVGGANP